jgi:PAS domain S-box-containing protein
MQTATSDIRGMLDTSPEEARRTHLWFLESMDRVHRAIQGTNEIERMMCDVLDAALAIFECDRAVLAYPCDPQTAAVHVPMQRTRPEAPWALAAGTQLPGEDDLRRVFAALRETSGPLRLGADAEYPVPARLAQGFAVRSALATAIYPKVDQPYLFALHQCASARLWTPHEVRLFEEIGRRLADGLTTTLIVRNLTESEARLAEAQRITHVTYADRDLETGVIKTSEEGYRMLGLPITHRPLTVADVIERAHPDDRARLERAITQTRNGNHYDIEYRVVQPNGAVRTVHSRGDVLTDESGRPRRSVGVVRDITEHKEAEYLMRQVFDSSPDGIAIVGRDYRYQRANRVYEAMWRIDPGTIVGRTAASVIGADVFERTSKPNLDRCFAGEDVKLSAWVNSAFGRMYAVISYTPLRPSADRVEAVLVIINDFTEHMLAQEALQKAQAELAHMSRVMTLSEIASSIAHEVNQPLAAITMSANACRRWLASEPPNLAEARDAIQRVVNDGNRASQVVGRVRTLLQRRELVSEALNVDELIQETLALVHAELARHDVVVRTDLRSRTVDVHGDRVQLQQVLVNLILNGVDAMGVSGGTPRVLTLRASRSHDAGVMVSVADTGIGLPADAADRIFNAFFSTKASGLGMGLSISRSIIEAHGGQLWATPNDGPGATLQFTLPPAT